jgi:hypothetical protein
LAKQQRHDQHPELLRPDIRAALITLSHRSASCHRFFAVSAGKALVSLHDAAQYIMRLPKAEQQATQWKTAAEVLILIGEHGGLRAAAKLRRSAPLRRP